MRNLHEHIVEGDSMNHQLTITVMDDRDLSGANHGYMISWGSGNPGDLDLARTRFIGFQKGPVRETGVNGLTHEALLAILIDRLRGFQSGSLPCRDNAVALTHLEEALMWLQRRTRERLRHGVEGTSEK